MGNHKKWRIKSLYDNTLGTGLRKVINSLISPSKTGAGVLKELGVQVNDTHGKMLPLNKIMAQLRDTTKSMSDSKRMDLFHSLFGTTGQASGAILVQNANALKKLNGQVERSAKANYVQRLSKKNMNNAENQMKRFKEAFKAVEIEMGVDFLPIITKASTALAGVLDHISRMGKGTKLLIAGLTVGIPVIATITGMLSTIIRGARGSYTAFFNLYKFITRKSGGQDLALDKTTETIDAQTLSVEKLAESWKQANVAKGEYSGETVAQTTTEPTVSEPVLTGKGTKTSPVTTSTVAKEVKTAEKTVAKTSTKGAGLIVDKDALGAMMRKSTQEGVSKGALVFKSVVGKAFTVAMLLPVISNVMSQGAEIFKNGINSKKGKTSAWHIAGTALAGGIGAIIGGPAGALWGANIGQEIVKAVDKRLPETDKRLKQSKEKNPQYKDQVSNNGITGAYQSGDGTISNVPTKPKKSSSKIPSGVLKEAQSVNNQFSQSMVNFDKMAGTSSAKAIQSMVKRNASIYKAVYSQASSYAKKQQKDSKSNLNSFVKQGFMTKSEEQTALSREKNYYKERLKNSKSGLSALVASDKRFAKEMQTEAKQHNSSLKDIHSKANKEITGLESKRNYDIARLTNGFYVKYKGQYLTGESGIAKIKSVYAKKIAKAQKLENDQIKDENKRHEDVMSSDERQEQKKRLRALQNAQTKTDLVFSKNSKVQERLAKKLKNSIGKISDQQAGKMILASYKAMKQTTKHAEETYKSAKKSADKKYKATVKSAEQEYFVNHSISKKQYNAIVKNAKQTRDDTVDAANDQRKKVEKQAKNQHKQIVKEAKAQSKDHLKTVDNETGKTLKGWKALSKNLGSVWSGMKTKIGGWLGKIAKGFNKSFKGQNKAFSAYGGSKVIGLMPEQYATGTGAFSNFRRPITKDTHVVLNDGNDSPETGNREMLLYPNGQTHLVEGRNTHMVVPAGTEIANATETKNIMKMMGLHFASGTGILGSLEKFIAGIGSSLKKKLKGLTDMASNAGKNFSDYFNPGIDKSDGSVAKEMSSLFTKKLQDQGSKWWNAAWSVMSDAAGDGGGAGGNWAHTPGLPVSNGFNASRGSGLHDGVDFSGPAGSAFKAVHGGTVIRTGPNEPWHDFKDLGNIIEVKSSDGYHEIYQEFGPMSSIGVNVGDTVKTGQTLGHLGHLAGHDLHVHVGVSKDPWHSNGYGHAGWYDITKMKGSSNGTPKSDDKSTKADSALTKLAKSQLSKAGVLSWIKKFLAPLNEVDDSGSFGGSGGNAITREMIAKAEEEMKVPKSIRSQIANNIMHMAISESGNRNIMQNISDINSANGTPAGGPLQYVKRTFLNFAVKGHENWASPYDQVLAFLNNSQYKTATGWTTILGKRKYDWLGSGPHGSRRFEYGGLSTSHQMAEISEYNKPEMILPLTNKTRTVQLAKEALNYVDRYDTTQKKATKVESKQDDELIKQNKTIISLLKALVVGQQNGQVISLDGKAVYDNVNKRMQKNQVRSNLGKGVSLA